MSIKDLKTELATAKAVNDSLQNKLQTAQCNIIALERDIAEREATIRDLRQCVNHMAHANRILSSAIECL